MPASMLPLILASALAGTATGDPITDAQSSLLSYGALGVFTLFAGLFIWSTIKRERREKDDAVQRHLVQSDLVRDQVVPALVRATDALTKATEATSRLTDLLPEVVVALSAAKRGRQ